MTVDGDYGITVTPTYPPKDFSIFIYYVKDDDNHIPIIENALKTTITTTLDWKETELHGTNL
jgi:hypothetical protein